MPAVATTCFDTPWRTPPTAVSRTARALSANLLLAQVLDAFPAMAVVVDDNRQVVAVNEATRTTLGKVTSRTLLGKRLGEILGCVHANEPPAGCGTTPSCCVCGAALALRDAREKRERQTMECHVLAERDGLSLAMDVRVHAMPVWLAGRYVTVLSLEDIAATKRKQALERVFFHDVLNTAHAIEAHAQLLGDAETIDDARHLSEQLQQCALQLTHEIRSQRDLAAAERGDLVAQRQHLPANLLLLGVRDLYGTLQGATLAWHPTSDAVFVDTDRTLAVRALGNLVKNALEATPVGGQVSVSVEPFETDVAYHVRNPTAIPAEHQRQIFHRSFTTKHEPGRGLGTYGARLIVEQYLDGRVDFESGDAAGTRFSVYLPRAR